MYCGSQGSNIIKSGSICKMNRSEERLLLLYRGSLTGPHPLITIRNFKVAWVCHTRLLSITIDRKLILMNLLKELKNTFVNKLYLLKKIIMKVN